MGGGRKIVLSQIRSFPQVSPSEDEEAFVRERSLRQKSTRTDELMEGKRRRRKKVRHCEDDEEDEKETKRKRKRKKKKDEDVTRPKEVKPDDVKLVGGPVKVMGGGRGRKTHYRQFEYGGNRYGLEDSMLLNQGHYSPMPYVAIIKDITQKQNGRIRILVQWFYRQEEAKKKGGGYWKVNDKRGLFYSFHRGEAPAESVMHRCMVYFVPAHKQLPKRRDNPGFIVQKVYDTDEKKLRNLTDKDYEVAKQHEIDILVEKSISRLGDLPDLEIDLIDDAYRNKYSAKLLKQSRTYAIKLVMNQMWVQMDPIFNRLRADLKRIH
ncbi:unnamed protein product [Eruca vesicaria subsp. sativa]|uniref:BAH domain-containing protein n=1 Tax=Eruca vesicaria subsp. sativa TaxID=29727 RepID=A0ABC8LIH7_ERUVS|nr:unnamed protein product [Eruca vesicaria subsp. sativa]